MGIKRVAFAGHDGEVDWLLHVCVVAAAAGVVSGWCCWLIYPCIFLPLMKIYYTLHLSSLDPSDAI